MVSIICPLLLRILEVNCLGPLRHRGGPPEFGKSDSFICRIQVLTVGADEDLRLGQ